MTVRTERELVMLEALHRLACHCSCLLGRGVGRHDSQCASNEATRALAKVRQLDTATTGQGGTGEVGTAGASEALLHDVPMSKRMK